MAFSSYSSITPGGLELAAAWWKLALTHQANVMLVKGSQWPIEGRGRPESDLCISALP
jgi:hypothetical protein